MAKISKQIIEGAESFDQSFKFCLPQASIHQRSFRMAIGERKYFPRTHLFLVYQINFLCQIELSTGTRKIRLIRLNGLNRFHILEQRTELGSAEEVRI